MRTLSLLALSFVIACGGGTTKAMPDGTTANMPDAASSSATVVMGDVNGRTFSAMDAISRQFDHTNGFPFQGTASFVEITDYASACAHEQQNQAPADGRILDLAVAINDSAGQASPPTGPGTFMVFSGSAPLPASTNVAGVYYGDACDKTVAFGGTSGTITVTAVRADGSFDGSFDVMISCAGFSPCAGPDAHLTGTFSSSACSALNVNRIPACG